MLASGSQVGHTALRRWAAHGTRAMSTAAQPFDVVVMGGGVMGSSIAYNIAAQDPNVKVAVVERDRTYAQASCVLSAGGIRMQFSNQENIEIHLGLEGGEEDSDINDHCDVQFKESGYLFLTDSDEGKAILEDNVALQRKCGAETVVLEAADLEQRYPWMNVDDLVAGSIGESMEGSFDPWSLLTSFKKKAVELGVTYVDGLVTGLDTTSRDGVSHVNSIDVERTDGTILSMPCGIAVNACGAWSRPIAAMAGVEFPVFPRLRSLFFVHCPAATYTLPPFTINPSGVYMRREGHDANGLWVCGVSPEEDNDPDYPPLFNVDELPVDHGAWEERVWPELYNRCNAFEEAKVVNSWCGFYEFNPFDHNAIIGLHAKCNNMMLASGFSGHGLMQSPAVGRAVSDLILHQRHATIDLSRMSPNRFSADDSALILERNVI